jgi:hypothetical protein
MFEEYEVCTDGVVRKRSAPCSRGRMLVHGLLMLLPLLCMLALTAAIPFVRRGAPDADTAPSQRISMSPPGRAGATLSLEDAGASGQASQSDRP